MEVKICEREKRFYLAADGWIPVVGNEITIGKYRFCATPCGNAINSVIIFSEVTSGARVKTVKLDFFDAFVLDTKSAYLKFLEQEAHKLVDLLSKQKTLEDQVLKMEYLAISKLGIKPMTEEIDIDEELEDVTY